MIHKVYACYLKDEEELEKSSSGGAFTALSNAVLRAGGVIIACSFDYDLHQMVFVTADTAEKRNEMRGSKYVQADPSGLYMKLQKELPKETQAPLLVVGTPCQIAGARAYVNLKFRKTHRPVIYCDLICHGVSSPVMWQEYMDLQEKKQGKRIHWITFKDKEKGWIRPTAKLKFEDGSFTSAEEYAVLYRSDDFMRDSCYHCKFSSPNRESDITIGDFWKIREVNEDFANARGTSVIMVHSEAGMELFRQACGDLQWIETTPEQALQPNMQHPTCKRKRYPYIQRDYKAKGLQYIIEKYVRHGPGNALIRRVRHKIQRMRFEGESI